MIIFVLVTLALAAGFAWALVHEERPVLFPEPPTLTEAMELFRVRMKELQIAFGTAFVPAAKRAAEVVSTFVDKVKESGLALSTQGFCPVCGNVTYGGVCIVNHEPVVHHPACVKYGDDSQCVACNV